MMYAMKSRNMKWDFLHVEKWKRFIYSCAFECALALAPLGSAGMAPSQGVRTFGVPFEAG